VKKIFTTLILAGLVWNVSGYITLKEKYGSFVDDGGDPSFWDKSYGFQGIIGTSSRLAPDDTSYLADTLMCWTNETYDGALYNSHWNTFCRIWYQNNTFGETLTDFGSDGLNCEKLFYWDDGTAMNICSNNTETNSTCYIRNIVYRMSSNNDPENQVYNFTWGNNQFIPQTIEHPNATTFHQLDAKKFRDGNIYLVSWYYTNCAASNADDGLRGIGFFYNKTNSSWMNWGDELPNINESNSVYEIALEQDANNYTVLMSRSGNAANSAYLYGYSANPWEFPPYMNFSSLYGPQTYLDMIRITDGRLVLVWNNFSQFQDRTPSGTPRNYLSLAYLDVGRDSVSVSDWQVLDSYEMTNASDTRYGITYATASRREGDEYIISWRVDNVTEGNGSIESIIRDSRYALYDLNTPRSMEVDLISMDFDLSTMTLGGGGS